MQKYNICSHYEIDTVYKDATEKTIKSDATKVSAQLRAQHHFCSNDLFGRGKGGEASCCPTSIVSKAA